MKKQIIEEIKDIKYLFNYNRGRVISEQPEVDSPNIDEELDMVSDDEDELPSFDLDGIFKGMSKSNGDMDTRTPKEREMDMRDIDMELDEEMDLPVMLPGTKEKERIKVDPGTKPKQPKTPYRPKPGPKPDPKAEDGEGDMPNWLSFDELGIDFE
jgi:hypothetical protein